MNTKILLLTMVAMATLTADATLLTLLGGGGGGGGSKSNYGYSANQEAKAPTLGGLIGAKIDGIQNFKGMLLSPFLMIASSLLGAKAGAPPPAPAPAPAAESYNSNDYGSYSNTKETSYSPKTDAAQPPATSPVANTNYLYGDTGRPDSAYAGGNYYDYSGASSSYDNYGRMSQPDYISKRTGHSSDYIGVQFGAPYGDSFGSASQYGGGDYYHGGDGYYQQPYQYGGGSVHGSGYRHGGAGLGAKAEGAKKGIGIGIGFNKKFEITWPSFKKGTKY